jgi:phosphoglycerate kinase
MVSFLHACQNQRVMLRVDWNVPIKKGCIVDATRIDASLSTIKALLAMQANIIVVSHLGRPTGPSVDESLRLVVDYLSQKLDRSIPLLKDWPNCSPNNHNIAVAENIRFHPEELENNAEFSKKMAKHCDVLMMDAFATAHRKHASTYGVLDYVETACLGPLVLKETSHLDRFLKQNESPCLGIVGGKKISTKLPLLFSLLEKVDVLVLLGAMANTCLAAFGYEMGSSFIEPSCFEQARKLQEQVKKMGKKLLLPEDLLFAYPDGSQKILPIDQADDQASAMDIGSTTIAKTCRLIEQSSSLLWCGPAGLFENDEFSLGTQSIALALARHRGYSLIGGGDTLAAAKRFDIANKVSYASTGGGAFLAYLAEGSLPVIDRIKRKEYGIKAQ